MSTFQYIHETCNEVVAQTESTTLLDLCCGHGELSQHLICENITGVDAYQPYLDVYLSKMNPTTKGILMDLAEDPLSSLKDNSYDTVICIDGVEHLEPEKAVCLINNMERVASKAVIIFTPVNSDNPEVPVLNTPPDVWGIEGGQEWQVHKSAHPPEYFLDKGYKIELDSLAKNAYDATWYRELLYSKIINSSETMI